MQLWHETISPPPGTPPPPDATTAQVVDSYVGSPIYEVIGAHQPALLVALLVPVVAWAVRRWWPHRLVRFDALAPLERMLAWILALSAVIHLGLLLSHPPSGFSLMYLGGVALPWWALHRLLSGKPWRRRVRFALLTLTLGYVAVAFIEPPDSFGLTTKLVEVTGLAIAFRPEHDTRLRNLGASVATFAITFAVAFGGWVGAFSAGDGGHHLGATPAPGVLLPPGEDRPATPAEQAAADALYHQTVDSLERYTDPAVAAAAGYDVAAASGLEGHADNPALKSDGRILDPEYPESLVYAEAPSGRLVLIGALFQMDDIGEPGPTPGGPLTVWHAHDHICLGLPIGLSGFTSPFGLCPLGTVTIPVTNEMLHIWTIPGLPEKDRYGDIDDQWLTAYLAHR